MTKRMPASLRAMYLGATLLAFFVVTLGAYVRLKDAGLGCPDWPGCYGQLVGVPETDATGDAIDLTKAWIEVSHRYAAALLGLLVLGCAYLAFRHRFHRAIASILLLLVIIQAGLGALTVTELLKPVIVSSHLLGGMAILAILAGASFSGFVSPKLALSAKTKGLLVAAALVLVVQIALGGWVSSNYAGLACGKEFPKCAGSWVPETDASAFAFDRELGKSAQGGPITQRALVYVQWIHRVGALALTFFIAALAVCMWIDGRRMLPVMLCGLLLTQLTIGIYIVMSLLPIGMSLAHNTVAALLAVAMAQAALPAQGLAQRK